MPGFSKHLTSILKVFKFYGLYRDLIKTYEVPLPQMLNDIV